MNQDKLNFYLVRIEKLYPNKTKLNAGEICQILGISRATFTRILDANNLHLLPKFAKNSHKRKGADYNTYQFDIFDIAIFLANKGVDNAK